VLKISRIVGNLLFIVGYVLILFHTVEIGVWVRLVGNLMSWPYFYRIRLWDMITVRSFFVVVEAAKLIELSLYR